MSGRQTTTSKRCFTWNLQTQSINTKLNRVARGGPSCLSQHVNKQIKKRIWMSGVCSCLKITTMLDDSHTGHLRQIINSSGRIFRVPLNLQPVDVHPSLRQISLQCLWRQPSFCRRGLRSFTVDESFRLDLVWLRIAANGLLSVQERVIVTTTYKAMLVTTCMHLTFSFLHSTCVGVDLNDNPCQ